MAGLVWAVGTENGGRLEAGVLPEVRRCKAFFMHKRPYEIEGSTVLACSCLLEA